MKGRDYRRLARLSLKARKKTTIQTIVGISFGLILLFPLLFIALGFYMGFNQEVDKNVSFRTFNVTYVGKQTSNTYVNYCYDDFEEKISSLPGIKKDVEFKNLGLLQQGVSYNIDNAEKDTLYNLAMDTNIGINVYNIEKGNDPYVQGDYKINPAALVSGKYFSEGAESKGEIMVSSAFAKMAGLRNSELVGHTITLKIPANRNYYQVSMSNTDSWRDEDLRTSNSFDIIKNYKIVGIFSSSLYKTGSVRGNLQDTLRPNGRSDMHMETHFWLTSASLDPAGKSYPEAIEKNMTYEGSEETYKQQWYYYEQIPEDAASALNEDGYAYFPFGFGIYDAFAVSNNQELFSYTRNQILEFDSFNSARNAYDAIEESFKASSTKTGEKITASMDSIALPGFTQYLTFYDIFLYICLAFAILGGVIFIATLLNLINTLHFSIESMKGFLGICRAEGLRSRGVVRLFLNQIYWIFFYGFIFTIVFGGGICVGIKMLFDNTVKSTFKDMTSLSFTIEWFYIPISLGILVVITTIISLVFSELLAGKASRTPILDILSEENK